MVSSTHRPHFTPGKDLIPILQEAGSAPGPVWTCGKSRPHRDSIPDHPARSSVAIPTELPGPLISGYVVKNTTMCLIRCYILTSKKLHASADSGHHKVLSFESIKIILYRDFLYTFLSNPHRQ